MASTEASEGVGVLEQSNKGLYPEPADCKGGNGLQAARICDTFFISTNTDQAAKAVVSATKGRNLTGKPTSLSCSLHLHQILHVDLVVSLILQQPFSCEWRNATSQEAIVA